MLQETFSLIFIAAVYFTRADGLTQLPELRFSFQNVLPYSNVGSKLLVSLTTF